MKKILELSSSKSLMNRALILQSYFPELKIQSSSQCDDVVFLKSSLEKMSSSPELYVGEGGTTLRFLALRVSRIPGRWILKGKPSLFRRPQQGLMSLMNHFGVESRWSEDYVEVISQGWKIPEGVVPIDVDSSSQFATSLLLNVWKLPQSLKFSISSKAHSESYFDLSLKFCRDLGLRIDESVGQNHERVFSIPAGQIPQVSSVSVEIDLSSAFSMACLAALHQTTEIKNFPFHSAQPDREFLNFFKKMGITFYTSGTSLIIEKAKDLVPLKADLKNTPDLFPVLAALCSQIPGRSDLYGAKQLVHKESNRLLKTKELLDHCGIPNELSSDGLQIQGHHDIRNKNEITFEPDQDHRMAMAAAVFKSVGYKIKIKNPEVVEKSFPEFWQQSEIQP